MVSIMLYQPLRNGALLQVKYGDALQVLPELQLPEGYKGIDLLLLDGVPKETLAYLQAAEPLLSEGAVVVADNAGASLVSLVISAAVFPILQKVF